MAVADHPDFPLVWNYLLANNTLYQTYVPLRCRDDVHVAALTAPAWQHITQDAITRDSVTDRHEHHGHNMATLDVHAYADKHSGRATASVGTVELMAPEDALDDDGHIAAARSTKGDILYKTWEANVHGTRRSIEGHAHALHASPQ